MDKEKFLRSFMEDIWNQKVISKVAHYLHSSYHIFLDTTDPWEGKTLDHEAFINRLQYSFQSFPDLHFEISNAIPEENHVAINWIMTGTNTGPIGEYPPTGKKIKTQGITIYHFTENKISGHTQVFDRMTVAKQLGFL